MILTTSADMSLPAFVRSCLRFAERAQATATLHTINGEPQHAAYLRDEAARFRSVAERGMRQRHLLEGGAA